MMRRFYSEADSTSTEDGHAVTLDGRLVRTPAKRPLVLPNASLAEAVAAEWEAQTGEIRPLAMPLTRLASTAIDYVRDHRAQVVDDVAGYAATDLVCHRAATPVDLAERQNVGWQPLLDWLDRRFGVRLRVTAGVIPVDQPDDALETMRAAVAECDDLVLTAVRSLTAATGSLVIALAVVDGRIEAETAWELSQIDETYQIEHWGEDAEAAERRARLRAEVLASAWFLDLTRR